MAHTSGPRPFVVHEVTSVPKGEVRTVNEFELRTAGMSVAASLLHIPVADFDCVRVAAAKADLVFCPVCGPHPRRAA